MSVFRIILVLIFPYSGWIQRDTPYLSVFSPNAGKCGPESFRIRTLFTQWILPLVFFEKWDKLLFSHLTQLWQHNSWLRGWTLFQWFECSNACDLKSVRLFAKISLQKIYVRPNLLEYDKTQTSYVTLLSLKISWCIQSRQCSHYHVNWENRTVW